MCLIQFTNAPECQGNMFGTPPVHCSLCMFSHCCQHSLQRRGLWLNHLNVWEMPFFRVFLTTKWLQPLNMLIRAAALPVEHVVYRLPKLPNLKRTTLFFASTPIHTSYSRSDSKGFCVKQVWIESGLCHLPALTLGKLLIDSKPQLHRL